MALDPRTPVLVGAGQVTYREGDAPEPVELLFEAVRAAAASRAVARVLSSVGSVRVVKVESRRYSDPAALVARRLGVDGAETVYTTGGGQSPQALLTASAQEIHGGSLDAILIGGAESGRTRRRRKGAHTPTPWTTQPVEELPTRSFGPPLHTTNDDERRIGMELPIHVYGLFESALRARHGWSPSEHLDRIASLWARCSTVAARNPHAALPFPRSPVEVREVTESNRMVATPYRKLMVANDHVDQAAAVLVCSLERAAAAGVPRDEWVFLHGAGAANDTPYVSNRDDLSRSPAIRAAGTSAMQAAGVGPDDLAFVDLYSCFPSAVQIAAEELGFGLERELTVTGGLTFAGGPWHNYVTHALATMVERLRESPDSFGLVTANGGMLTKHAAGVYSCRPPGPFGAVVEQRRFDPTWRRAEPSYVGPVVVEAATVVHNRAERPLGFVAGRTSRGARVLASVPDDAEDRLVAGVEGTRVNVASGRVV